MAKAPAEAEAADWLLMAVIVLLVAATWIVSLPALYALHHCRRW